MKCPQCQSENRAEAKFCDECGCRLAPAAEAPAAPDEPGLSAQITAKLDLPLVMDAADAADAAAVPEFPQAAVEAEPAVPEVEPEPEPAAVPVPEVPGVAGDRAASPAAETAEVPVRPRLAIDIPELSPDDAPIERDFTGLERIVDSSYVPAAYSGRAGDTLEFPRIEGEKMPSALSYRVDDDDFDGDGGGGSPFKRALVIVVLVAILLAALIGGSYYLQLWGGKVIPDVANTTQADAIALLERQGFAIEIAQVKSDEAEGLALSTDPAAGNRADAGTLVVLHITTPRIIPEIVGRPQMEAERLLSDEGFEAVTFKLVKSDETPGSVLFVEPKPGSRATAMAAIVVEIADPYTVPEVAGMANADAAHALEEAGYTVSVEYVYDDSVPEGTALSTEPSAGSPHKSGSEVVLNIALSRAAELERLTHAFFSDSMGAITINGQSYEVSEIASVAYAGEGTCSFTIVARPFETHTWMFGIGSETRYGNYETITGQISWSSDNAITATTPNMHQGT